MLRGYDMREIARDATSATMERGLLHEIFAASGNIHLTPDELQIISAPLNSPHRTRAVQTLCELLDQTSIVFPGTRMHLRFAVRQRPLVGLAFPGTPARPHAVSAP